jgi:hypothetical protein
MQSHRGMILTREKPKNVEKICASTTVFTTKPTWTDLDVNPGIHGERLATNHLSHGKTCFNSYWCASAMHRQLNHA